MATRSIVCAFALLAACRPAPVGLPLTRAEVPAEEHAAPPSENRGVSVDVHGPRAIPYAMTAIGLNGAEVTFVLRNTTNAARVIGPIDVRFAVQRDGVPFRCDRHHESLERETLVLAPGQAVRLSRTMHCWTPIPGRYEVQAFVALDATSPYALAGTFAMDVEAHPAWGPRECPTRPGLYVAMGGERKTPPIPLRPDGREDGYHAVIVLANASARAVPGGRVDVAFVVRKKGSAVVCGGETLARTLPDVLAPGEVYVLRLPVGCIREVQGEYVVSGELAFEGDPAGTDAIEVGKMGVRVTNDPLLLWPITP